MRFHKILRHTDGRRSPIYRGTAILNFNIQGRYCHAERSISLPIERDPSLRSG